MKVFYWLLIFGAALIASVIPAAAQDSDGPRLPIAAPVQFTVTLPACFDRLDNDQDSRVDYPSDPGCLSREDEDEFEPGVASAPPAAVKRLATRVKTSAPYQVLERRVFNNPVVEEVSVKVAAPVITVATAANTSAAASSAAGWPALWVYLQGLFSQPLLLLARRKRKEWGIVYSSLTKLPVDLALVRLLDSRGKLRQTGVTDQAGRYLFVVDPGVYQMEIKKPGFSFPSVYLKDKSADLDFSNLYHGEALTVSERAAAIARSVPVDPLEKLATPQSVRAAARRRAVQTGLAWTGPLLAALVVLIRPTLTSAVILAIQFLFLGLFKRMAQGAKPRSFGAVHDAQDDKPLALVVVRIFDTEFNRLLDTKITDRAGRYAFLVGRGNFYVTAEKPGYAAYRSKSLDFSQTGADELVQINIVLKLAPS